VLQGDRLVRLNKSWAAKQLLNPKLSRPLSLTLVAAAVLLPLLADYFVFFSMLHFPSLHRPAFAYGFLALALVAGIAFLAVALTGPARVLAPFVYTIATIVGTSFASIYVACNFYGSCP
jgi:hypothetical protein